MEKLKDLEKRVQKILEQNPKTRGDDDLLYNYVMKEMKVDLNVSAKDFLLSYRKLGLPTIESVGRARRKIQEKDETLKPTPDIILNRKKLETSFYNYSVGMKEC